MVSRNLLLAVVAGNLLMVISGASEVWFNMNVNRITTGHLMVPLMFSELIGEILGSILFAILAEIIGRKYSLLIVSIPLVAGFIFCEIFYTSQIFVCIGRALTSLFVGGTFCVLPIYIAEISDLSCRGKLVSILFTSFVLGKLLFSGIIKLFHSTPALLSYSAGILVVIFVTMFGLAAPESPFYYLKKGRRNSAKIALSKLRYFNANIELELDEMQGKVDWNSPNAYANENIMSCMNIPGWVKSVVMAFGVTMAASLFVTDESIIYIFLSNGSVSLQTTELVYGIIQLSIACICPILVDRIGRKLLLTISLAGNAVFMLIFFICLTIHKTDADAHFSSYYLLAVLVLAFSICTSTGAAPIRFVLISELFSMESKMLASCVLTSLFFILRTVFVNTFDIFDDSFIFTIIVIAACLTVFVAFFYLETNKKSLPQIQFILNKNI